MKKRMITAYIIAIAGSLGAAALFQLSLAGAGILCVVSGLLIPFFEKNRKRELAQTKEYQEKVAAAVSEGIRTYLNAQ